MRLAHHGSVQLGLGLAAGLFALWLAARVAMRAPEAVPPETATPAQLPIDSAPEVTEKGRDAWLEHYEKLCAQRDPQLSFKLTIASGRAQFRMGEVIPVTLSFEYSGTQEFYVNLTRTDASGRVDFDAYCVDRADAVSDPLLHGNGGFFGFNLQDIDDLFAPRQVTLPLNQFVRFDQPGQYRLYAMSNRVLTTGDEWTAVPSSMLELEILPRDRAWEAEEFRGVAAELPAIGVLPCYWSDAQRRASDALLYLGTPESTRELARRVAIGTEPGQWDTCLGLLYSPERELAITELEHSLVAPETAVTRSFLWILCQIASDAQVPRPREEDSLADFPFPMFGGWWEEYRTISGKHIEADPPEAWFSAYQRIHAHYRQLLEDSLSNKLPAARTQCEETLAAEARK